LRTTALAASLALALSLTDIDAIAGNGGGADRRPIALMRGGHLTSLALPKPPSDIAPTPQVPVLPVANCDDDGGPGTLRSVVAGAVSGAIIDMSALTCSTISLANGAIAIPFDSLRIVGPAGGLEECQRRPRHLLAVPLLATPAAAAGVDDAGAAAAAAWVVVAHSVLLSVIGCQPAVTSPAAARW